MTEKAKNITATNLDLRLTANGSKDELSEMANTFNEMLNRLENSFDAQKHFVSNISHELRTPLAAIITELELSTNKNRNLEEYKIVIRNTLNDARKLARLSNSLLDLAKASYDPSEISFKTVRIDEVLLDAKKQVQQASPEYKIDIHFECDIESDNQISVHGNEYLLKVAFVNLFENGCKFSIDRSCSVYISFNPQSQILYPKSQIRNQNNPQSEIPNPQSSIQNPQSKQSAFPNPQSQIPNPQSKHSAITLIFKDKGIGIPEEELKNIFTPFYRGENKQFASGNGIGLSLTQKIIHLHKGRITVSSIQDEGTTFSLELLHI
jgi:two-component system sensor histidine kinase ArlS